MKDLRQMMLLASRAQQKLVGDPIANYRFNSYANRAFARSLDQNEETALQTSNSEGKTTVAARCFVAMMRGVRELCGDIVGWKGVVEKAPPVLLPLIQTPCTFAVLAQGHEMAKLSLLKALKKSVGAHPHHWEKQGGVVRALRVKPDNSDSPDWEDWSQLRIFVEDGQSVAGMRLDGVWADEPPDWDVWMEMRMRMEENQRMVRAITFTPILKARWKPVVQDFKGCDLRPRGGKYLIRASIYDNLRLTPSHLKRLEEAAAGPLKDAKLLGDPVDVDNSCPFDKAHLKIWRSRCRPPIREEKFRLSRGQEIKWQIWEDPNADEPYVAVFDPSSGVWDEATERDPAGMVVVGRRSRRVVARYGAVADDPQSGYVIPSEFGRFGAQVCRRYNNALMVFERNSGYGPAFFDGTKDERGNEYGHVYVEWHGDSVGLTLMDKIGWYSTASSRGTIIGALQKALAIPGALFLFSEDAVESLSNVAVRRDGIRIEAGAGCHDEDMIVLGLAAHLLETEPVRTLPLSMTEKFDRAFGVTPANYNDMDGADWG